MRGTPKANGNYAGEINKSRIARALIVTALVFLCGSSARANSAIPQSGYVVSATPSSFAFSYKIGGAVPATQTVVIDDTTPNALPFTLSTDQPWITTSLTSSQTKAFLQFGVNPAGLAAGTYSGHIFVTAGIVVNSPLAVPIVLTVSAGSTSGALTANPTSVSFGNVNLGSTVSQRITLSNTSNASVRISQATVGGSGFSTSGMTLPMTIASGQSYKLTARFAPSAIGNSTGTITLTSNASQSTMVIGLQGSGIQSSSNYVVSTAPSSFVFSYQIGAAAPATQTAVIDDTTPNALPFTVSKDQSWITTSATASQTRAVLQFGVNPSGLAAGIYSGHIFITAAIVSNSPLAIPVVLTVTGGTAAGTISANPTSLAFGNINVGNSMSKTTQITNTGSASVTISQVNIAGAGMSASGITTPMTLAAGQTTVLTVAFAPSGAGAVSGSASIMSNSTNSPLTITTSGTGTQPQLTASPTSFNFGSVNVGSSGSHSFTVSNSGNSSLTISQIGISGTVFTMSGMTAPATLAAGQSASFSVQFAPTAGGGVSGSVSLVSNSPNSPTTIALSGTGVASVTHSVSVLWTASTSNVAGYNVYVSNVSGGSYVLLNSGLVNGSSYTDSSVQSGKTYYFVVTAVDANGTESVVSNEVSAIIP